MSRLRDESGVSLIELLVAMFVSLVVFGASMSILIVILRNSNNDQRQNDAQQTARQTMDTMERQLRNLASPTSVLGTASVATLPRSIDRDLPSDMIFKDVDQVQPAGSLNKPNVRRVRYCLDSTTPSNGKLYRQIQTWTTDTEPAMPAATACPGTGWGSTSLVAANVTNAVGNRAVFTYSGNAGVITATDSTSRSKISRITTTLDVDADPTQRPAETTLVSAVFLRNQNREPTASMTGLVLNSTTRTIQLNGSSSQDPESQPLTYQWFMDGTQIGQGVLLQYNVPSGVHSFQLKVFDPAGLEGDSSTYSPFTS